MHSTWQRVRLDDLLERARERNDDGEVEIVENQFQIFNNNLFGYPTFSFIEEQHSFSRSKTKLKLYSVKICVGKKKSTKF